MGVLTASIAAAVGAGATFMLGFNRGRRLEREREADKPVASSVAKIDNYSPPKDDDDGDEPRRPPQRSTSSLETLLLHRNSSSSEGGAPDKTLGATLEAVMEHLALDPNIPLLLTTTTIGIVLVSYVGVATLISSRLAKAHTQAWPALLRVARDKDKIFKRHGGAALATDLLPMIEGNGSLREALVAHGLRREEPLVGAAFDAASMEAVGMEATDDVSLVVKAVVSPGYSWHGERVLTKTQVEVEPEA